MPNELKFLTRIRPLACGRHDPTKAYEINSLVVSADGVTAYLSLQDVPAGTELGNEAYWMVHTDLTSMAKGLEMQAADDLARISRGHLRRIYFTQNVRMQTYRDVNGAPELSTTLADFSELLPCPRYLGLNFVDGDDGPAGCYLYFYRKTDNGYEIDWSVLDYTTNSGVKNFIGRSTARGALFTLPEGMYMRIGRYKNGVVELYEWDGEPFGPAVSADLTSYYNEYTLLLNERGGSGITVPGEAKAIVCRENCSFGAIRGIKIITDDMPETEEMFDSNGVKKQFLTTVLVDSPVRFFKLPGGYDYYRVHFNENDVGDKVTYTGDVNDKVCIACPSEGSQRASARALLAIERGRKLNQISWTPAADLKVHNSNRTFKSGVTYNGLPYGPGAYTAHFIGWHVSLHTFLNAINDPDSVMYKDANGGMPAAPFYSTVCNVYASMVAGWPVPVSNVGLLYDPNVDYHVTNVPEIGSVWSNIYELRVTGNIPTHCVVPERIDWRGDKCSVSAYEAVVPISERTTRYSELAKEKLSDGYRESSGKDYYDGYGVAAHYIGKPEEMGAPYLDFDDLRIVNGTARPYKGDKSVYTSEEAVLINIKASNASTLYLLKKGETNAVPVTINKRPQIDIKEQVEQKGTGVYYVYTDVDSIQESFEYVDIPDGYALTWEIEKRKSLVIREPDGKPSRGFWYAQCGVAGHPYLYDEKKAWDTLNESDTPVLCAWPYKTGEDSYDENGNNLYGENAYSRWFEGDKRITKVHAVFFKGQYGAYTVPIAEKK